MKLDYDEKRINSALCQFSQLEVDTDNLERKVKENMRNRRVKPALYKRAGFIVAASFALMVLITGSVYAATGLGIFDRFITQHEIPFAEIIEPVEEYVVANGIRTDIIATQMFDNQAIVYLAVRDISGENRLTERSNIMVTGIDVDSNGAYLSFITQHIIHFDEESNTAYFELGLAFSDAVENVEIHSINLLFGEGAEFSEPISLSLGGQASVIPLPDESDAFLPEHIQYMLAPATAGAFPDLPYVDGGQWISGLAIIDGYLHVQLGSEGFGDFHMDELGGMRHFGFPVLTRPDGEVSIARSYYQGVFAGLSNQPWASNRVRLYTDENLRPIDPLEFIQNTAPDTVYVFQESVFPINVDELDLYSLYLYGFYVAGVNIDMDLRIDVGDRNQIRTIRDTMVLGNTTVQTITISPLGVRFAGTFEDYDEDIDGVFAFRIISFLGENLTLETLDGDISLGRISTALPMRPTMTFSSFTRADSPIDVESVTAVIVDGVRIPLE